MRYLLFMIITFSSVLSNAQENDLQKAFTFNHEGLTPKHVIKEVADKNKKELFDKAINWIKETYNNPDEVIQMTIEGEKLRFKGIQENALCYYAFGIKTCFPAIYTIEIEFKDDKYKFNILTLELINDEAGRVDAIDLNDGSGYYKSNGSVRKQFEYIPTGIENIFNGLYSDLNDYIVSEKNDDW